MGFFELSIDDSRHKSIEISRLGYLTSTITIPKEERFKVTLQKEYLRLNTLYLDLFPLPIDSIPIVKAVNTESFATPSNGVDRFYAELGNSLNKIIGDAQPQNVSIRFTIDENGKAIDIEVTPAQKMAEAVRRAFEEMTPWIPAEQHGSRVTQSFTIFVAIRGSASGAVKRFSEFILATTQVPLESYRKGLQGPVDIEFSITENGEAVIKTLAEPFAELGNEARLAIKRVPSITMKDLTDATKTKSFLISIIFGAAQSPPASPRPIKSSALRLPDIYVTAVEEERNEPFSATQLVPHVNWAFPESMWEPELTKRVSLTRKGLTSFPTEVLELPLLEGLDLNDNNIQSVPEEISHLRNLEELHLTKNQIDSLPGSISTMRKLTIVRMGDNDLKTFPPPLLSLKNLSTLDLSNNQITTIPKDIVKLKNLKVLMIPGNPIPPEEVDQLKRLLRNVMIVF